MIALLALRHKNSSGMSYSQSGFLFLLDFLQLFLLVISSWCLSELPHKIIPADYLGALSWHFQIYELCRWRRKLHCVCVSMCVFCVPHSLEKNILKTLENIMCSETNTALGVLPKLEEYDMDFFNPFTLFPSLWNCPVKVTKASSGHMSACMSCSHSASHTVCCLSLRHYPLLTSETHSPDFCLFQWLLC